MYQYTEAQKLQMVRTLAGQFLHQAERLGVEVDVKYGGRNTMQSAFQMGIGVQAFAISLAPDAWGAKPMSALVREPGLQFIGVTAIGREIPCTVGDDGAFHADSYEVCKLVGWK